SVTIPKDPRRAIGHPNAAGRSPAAIRETFTDGLPPDPVSPGLPFDVTGKLRHQVGWHKRIRHLLFASCEEFSRSVYSKNSTRPLAARREPPPHLHTLRLGKGRVRK